MDHLNHKYNFVLRASPFRWDLKKIFIGFLALTVVLLISLPLVYLLVRALESGEQGVEYLLRPRTITIFVNSIILTVIVVVASGIIGLAFAWFTTRTTLPFKRVFLILGLLPMVIPSYIGSLTLIEFFGPVGILQKVLAPLGIQRLPEIYGLGGAAFAITLFTYPYFVLPLRAALLNMDQSLEEAAQSLGCSRQQIFWRIIFPILRPSLAVGALLTALYTLSDFGAVMVMRYNAFSRAIYIAYESSFDRNRAAILALVLVAFTLFLTVLERRAGRSIRTYRIGKGTTRKAKPIDIGKWQFPAIIFLSIPIMLGVILPISILFNWALNPVTSTIDMRLGEASWNAGTSSAITAMTCALMALPLVLLNRQFASRASRGLMSLSYIGNALPGVAVGLALVFFGANAFPNLYQTLPLLILGYAIRFLPYSLGSTQTAFARINPALEEVAQSLGASSLRILWRITLPLAWTGITAGMGLVFLNTMKELPTTLMLAPIGFVTPATRIWMASESAYLSLIGQPGLILIALSCVGLIIILWRDAYVR